MKASRITIAVLCLTLFACKPKQPVQPEASTTPKAIVSEPTPEAMAGNKTSTSNAIAILNESYDVGKKLGGEERSFYLVEHCRVSVSIRSKEDAARYCREALREAEQVKNDCLRQKLKVKSVGLLSEVSPVEALDELGKLPFVPCPVDRSGDDPIFHAK